MHFFYLDEAGCTGRDLRNTQQPIFVLGGISVRDEGWNITKENLEALLLDYFEGPLPMNFELHAEELLSPNGDGPFEGHARDKRNALAMTILQLLKSRKHNIHILAIDKAKMETEAMPTSWSYPKAPYLLAYYALIGVIDHYVRTSLGRSARAMIILDIKEEFRDEIESITLERRFLGRLADRCSSIVEFSYPVDSMKNPMVQLSDLVVHLSKKFFEMECGYRPGWLESTRNFFREAYTIIDSRCITPTATQLLRRRPQEVMSYLIDIQSRPRRGWRAGTGDIVVAVDEPH